METTTSATVEEITSSESFKEKLEIALSQRDIQTILLEYPDLTINHLERTILKQA